MGAKDSIVAIVEMLENKGISQKLFYSLIIIFLFAFVAYGSYRGIDYYFTHLGEQYGKNIISDQFNFDKKINLELTSLLYSNNADRAFLSKYHDSVKGIDGNHFVFISETNEQVRRGIDSTMQTSQNLPTGIRAEWNEKNLKGECVWAKNIKTEAPASLVQIAEDHATASVISCPVFDNQHSLLGFVGVSYVRSSLTMVNDTVFEQRLHEVNNTATKLGIILSTN